MHMQQITLNLFSFIFIGLIGLSPAVLAADTEPLKAIFIQTEEMLFENGTARLEVQSFDVSTQTDLNEATRQIRQQLDAKPATQNSFTLDIRAGKDSNPNIEYLADRAVRDLNTKIESEHVTPKKVIQTDAAEKKGFLARNYNLSLALVRFTANSVVVATGLIIGKDLPIEHAAMIGVLAGSMSAVIQLNSEKLGRYLENSVILVNLAKRTGLIRTKPGDNPSWFENRLRDVEKYGRWATLEAGFLKVVETGMSILGIPIAENILWPVAKSTASQGVYEIGVYKFVQELEKMNPAWKSKAAVFRNVALFGGSSISVLAAIGTMVGIPIANLGFVTLFAGGVVLHFAPKLMMTRTFQQMIRTWKPRSQLRMRCQGLMAL